MSRIKIDSYGGNGGKPFEIRTVKKIGVRSDQRIDGLHLNGEFFGGGGGDDRTIVTLDRDEYIISVKARTGRVVDKLELRTNKGTVISGGSERDFNREELTNIRVIGIGGNAKKFLDKITIEYITDYTPSVFTERSKAVIDIVSPGTQIQTTLSQKVRKLVASTKVMEKVFSVQGSPDSKSFGEYVSKVSLTAGFKKTEKEEIKREVETEVITTESEILTPPENNALLELCDVNVFHDTETDFRWFEPIGNPEFIAFPLDIDNLGDNYYDITGSVGAQFRNLRPIRTQRFGYDFYPLQNL